MDVRRCVAVSLLLICLYVSLSVCLSLGLAVYMSVCLSVSVCRFEGKSKRAIYLAIRLHNQQNLDKTVRLWLNVLRVLISR